MYINDRIIAYENSGEYKKAMNEAFTLYKASPKPETLLCAALENWYFLFNDVKYGVSLLGDEEINRSWTKLYKALEAESPANDRVKFFYGYMLAIGPYLFYDRMKRYSYAENQNFGYALMGEAYSLKPREPLFALQQLNQLKWEQKGLTGEQEDSREALMAAAAPYLPTRGIVNRYFRCIYGID